MVSLSPKAQLTNLGDKYDVTHLSSKEMKSLATDLRGQGLINEKEYMDLTFVFVPPGGTYDENAPINYLKQYQAQTEF